MFQHLQIQSLYKIQIFCWWSQFVWSVCLSFSIRQDTAGDPNQRLQWLQSWPEISRASGAQRWRRPTAIVWRSGRGSDNGMNVWDLASSETTEMVIQLPEISYSCVIIYVIYNIHPTRRFWLTLHSLNRMAEFTSFHPRFATFPGCTQRCRSSPWVHQLGRPAVATRAAETWPGASCCGHGRGRGWRTPWGDPGGCGSAGSRAPPRYRSLRMLSFERGMLRRWFLFKPINVRYNSQKQEWQRV